MFAAAICQGAGSELWSHFLSLQGNYKAAQNKYSKALRYLNPDVFNDMEEAADEKHMEEVAAHCYPLLLNR